MGKKSKEGGGKKHKKHKSKKDKKDKHGDKSEAERDRADSVVTEHHETTEEVLKPDEDRRKSSVGEGDRASQMLDDLRKSRKESKKTSRKSSRKMSRQSLANEGEREMFEKSSRPATEAAPPPLPPMYSDMINLIDLNLVEEHVLRKVIKKDEDYKKTVNERLSVLLREIKMIRSWEEEAIAKEQPKGKKKKPLDVNKMCVRCRRPDGILGAIKWVFVKKPRCQRCNYYTCNQCRHKQVNGKWLCSLCVRYRELQHLTGDWFPYRRCKGISGSELVMASLRVLEQNPHLRDKPVVEEQPPPTQFMKKPSKSGKHRIRRKSSVRISRTSSQPKGKGGRKSTVTNAGRRSTMTAAPFGRRRSSAKDVGRRKSSATTAQERPSIAQSEVAKAEADSEPAAEEARATEGETSEAAGPSEAAAEDKDAGDTDAAGNKGGDDGAGKSGKKKHGSKKDKGKKKSKGGKKSKGKGNVNVSFATEGRGVWNNSYEERNRRATESSESSRTFTESTDSTSVSNASSDYSMPIGTSAAAEERQRRRKIVGKLSASFFEKIKQPVYSSHSNKNLDSNKNDTHQCGQISKSSSDFKSWITYVNKKRQSLCKRHTQQESKKESMASGLSCLFETKNVGEHSFDKNVLKGKVSHERLQGSSTSNAPTLKTLWEPTQSVQAGTLDDFTKLTNTSGHKQDIISTETHQIFKGELCLSAKQIDTLPKQIDTLQNYADSTTSPNKQNKYSSEISRNDKDTRKSIRKHTDNNDSKKSARKQADTDNSNTIRKHTEIDNSQKPIKYVEKADLREADKDLSRDIIKDGNVLTKHYIISLPSPETIYPSRGSRKHRPGKTHPRSPSNKEIRPINSFIIDKEEDGRENGSFLFPNLNKSTMLRRLKCPVSYMFEYNASASSLVKNNDGQSAQDWNINFPHRPKTPRKSKSSKKPAKGKASEKGKPKKKSKPGEKDDKSEKDTKSEKDAKPGKGKTGKAGGDKKDTKAKPKQNVLEKTESNMDTKALAQALKKRKRKKSTTLDTPVMLRPSKLGLDLLRSGSIIPPPPPARVKMESTQVQTEFKRKGTRCIVCPFCRLYCDYGKEQFT